MAASMRVRFELFVHEMGAAVALYTGVMGFDLVREEPGYASLRRGEVILGLGPISKLPAEGGYFTRDIAEQQRGLGVEIVLEVDDLDAYHARILASGYELFKPLRERLWGLRDFRVVDPDGYYLRITSRA
jgi:lactoylglutathione lyase